MLLPFYMDGNLECGCDEAGRGCLAGPVYAAAVILPSGYSNALLNDSKKLPEKQRNRLRIEIERDAEAWAVAWVGNDEIDEINILNASILAMHKALDRLKTMPHLLLIDGNRFKAYPGIPHHTIIRGDSLYMSIAAASILAKTHRDEFMNKIAPEFPDYGWGHNKGYPTLAHRKVILERGFTPFHRKTFTVQV
jgi:ribonuclease HII